jgi:hypothetical protein
MLSIPGVRTGVSDRIDKGLQKEYSKGWAKIKFPFKDTNPATAFSPELRSIVKFSSVRVSITSL